jgi:hypothetical protein
VIVYKVVRELGEGKYCSVIVEISFGGKVYVIGKTTRTRTPMMVFGTIENAAAFSIGCDFQTFVLECEARKTTPGIVMMQATYIDKWRIPTFWRMVRSGEIPSTPHADDLVSLGLFWQRGGGIVTLSSTPEGTLLTYELTPLKLIGGV